MSPTFSTVATLFGFSLGGFLIAQYRLWKARRREIPLEFNPKTGVWEPDLVLKRWERRAKIAVWANLILCVILAFLWGAMTPPSLPEQPAGQLPSNDRS
ncbi:hypothetical protein WG907_05315 [Sphingobium sp. AN558]|uniref:hypothetical protein n=1 Tax=Sphingobium sp. AN558 TaxID=3133442 RepID=UPI0030C5E921